MPEPEWTWDPVKAASNLQKHSVSFELAALVFRDPFHRSEVDADEVELRWRTLGLVGNVLLFVVHTEPRHRGGRLVGRIISARKATTRERRRYEDD